MKTTRFLVIGLLLAAGILFSQILQWSVVGRAPDLREQERSATQKVPRQSYSGTLYFGSDEKEDPKRAWFVWLRQDGTGSLYLPPGTEPLKNVKFSQKGRISFSAESFDVRYEFSGSLENGSIRGEFHIMPPVAPQTRQGVTLRPVALPVQGSNDWQRSGLFSNASVNDQSGDLNGVEMLVVVTGKTIVGSHTDFQEEFSPSALGDVTPTAEGFRFRLSPARSDGWHLAAYRDKALLVRPDDVRDQKTMILRKRESLDTAFR